MITKPNYMITSLNELPVHGDFLRHFRKKECRLVFKEKLEQKDSVKTPEPVVEENVVKEENIKSVEEDLIGTPLECPFNLEVLKIKDDEFYFKESESDSRHASALKSCEYRPFTSYEARKILSSLMKDPVPFPVLCLCDAQDGERTTILGFEKGKKELIHYKVSIEGPIKSTNENIQLEKLKSEMEYLANKEDFSSQTFASYEVYRGTSLHEDVDQDDSAFVRLECTWKNPTKILELPHIASQAKVIVRPLPGEKCSGAFEIWRQLNTLQHLIKGLNSMEIVWFPQNSEISLRDEIDKLIRAFTRDETDVLKGKMKDDELYSSELNYKRTPMDFIDHLWELLSQNCSSFNDLSQCLSYTYQKAKADHPMMFFDNPTKFGKMLRQNDARPHFSGMEPVSLLIEMGIEKLKRDYLYIFSGNNLVAERVISAFLPQDGMEFESQLQCLVSIHQAVEVVSLLQGVLKLPHLTLRDVVPSLLDHYRENGNDEFSFQLGVCLLKEFFKHQESGSTVDKWMVEFTSSSVNPVKLVYQLTATNIISAQPHPEDEKGENPSSVGQRLFSVERFLCRSHPVAHHHLEKRF